MSFTNYNEVDQHFQQSPQKYQHNPEDQHNPKDNIGLHTDNQELQCLDGEEIIELVGGFGLYQLMYTSMFAITWTINAVMFVAGPILYQQVDLRCYDPIKDKYYQCTENNGGCEQPVIQLYQNTYNTMTSEFGLYCDKKHVRQYGLVSIYLITAIVVPILTWLTDIYGRKNIIVISQLIYSFLSVLIPIIDDLHFQIINNCLISAITYALVVVQFAFINESSGIKARSNTIGFLGIAYSLGSVVYPYLFELIKDWKTTNFVTVTIPALISCLQLLFIQETPLFLFQQKDERQLTKVIHKIAYMNSRSHLIKPKYNFNFVESYQNEQLQYSYFDLLKLPKLRIMIISCTVVQFACQVAYSGVNFCLQNIGLDIYLNTIIVQIGQLIGQVVFILIASSFRRRRSMMVSLFISFLINFMQIFALIADRKFSSDNSSGRSSSQEYVRLIQLCFVFIAKIVGCISQTLISIYYTEVFPTEVKNQVSGLIISIGIVGITIVPFIVDLASYIQSSPLFIVSFIVLLGFFFSFFFIETLNKPLLYTVYQFENHNHSYDIVDSPDNNQDPKHKDQPVPTTQVQDNTALLHNN